MNAPAAIPQYAAGAGFVVHRTGARWNREQCERARQYLLTQIADPSGGPESEAYLRGWLAELDSAIAQSWPQGVTST